MLVFGGTAFTYVTIDENLIIVSQQGGVTLAN